MYGGTPRRRRSPSPRSFRYRPRCVFVGFVCKVGSDGRVGCIYVWVGIGPADAPGHAAAEFECRARGVGGRRGGTACLARAGVRRQRPIVRGVALLFAGITYVCVTMYGAIPNKMYVRMSEHGCTRVPSGPSPLFLSCHNANRLRVDGRREVNWKISATSEQLAAGAHFPGRRVDRCCCVLVNSTMQLRTLPVVAVCALCAVCALALDVESDIAAVGTHEEPLCRVCVCVSFCGHVHVCVCSESGRA